MDITRYLAFDSPVPYKDLLIYPVRVEDYTEFTVYSQCLSIDKDSIPDVKIISMNYLEYLFYCTVENPEEEPYLILLDRLLSLCLKDEESFDNLESSIFRYNNDEPHKPFFMINNKKYNSDDFENIRNIIIEQNLITLPDQTISKDVRDSYEKARKYIDKLKNEKPATLEDYMISLAITTGWTFEYIRSLTIRKFIQALRRMDNYVHYKIYLTASMSGFVEFKDKSIIKHWLSNLEQEDKYKDVSISLDEIQGKISFESAKKK